MSEFDLAMIHPVAMIVSWMVFVWLAWKTSRTPYFAPESTGHSVLTRLTGFWGITAITYGFGALTVWLTVSYTAGG